MCDILLKNQKKKKQQKALFGIKNILDTKLFCNLKEDKSVCISVN